MKPDEILEIHKHRPFELPEGSWVMRQVWHDLLFAHWPIEKELITPHIPKDLQLDLWQGAAWVTISPFYIRPLHIRWLPPPPFVRSFLEFNMRTYVTYKNRPGIYLLSVDASSRLAVEAARFAGLPYLNADMSMKQRDGMFYYTSERKDKRGESASFKGIYYPTSSEVFHASHDSQLYWLTERYRLYTQKRNGVMLAIDIHHIPWPLQTAELTIEKNSIGEVLEIKPPNSKKPILTYSGRQDVLIWPPKKVESRG